MSLRDHFVQMARNNAWSNARLYGVCRKLDATALRAPRTSYFPSIWLTLQHLWIVDEYYVDGLERAGRGKEIWADEEKHQDIESLWKAQNAVDRRLLALCEHKATDADWNQSITLQRQSGPQVDLASDIVAHLFIHQIHHRGQVHAMLAGTDLAPPQLDEWFLANDRKLAEPELAKVL
ncbi:MAG: DinB family protein [Polyangiales bacterium]